MPCTPSSTARLCVSPRTPNLEATSCATAGPAARYAAVEETFDDDAAVSRGDHRARSASRAPINILAEVDVEYGVPVLLGELEQRRDRVDARAVDPDVQAPQLGDERARAELGRLDIWVNSAGIYSTSPLLELTEEDWDAVLDVNLRGDVDRRTGGGARDDHRGRRRRHGRTSRRPPRTGRWAGRLALCRLQVRRARADAESCRRARSPRNPRPRRRPHRDADGRPRRGARATLEQAGFMLDELGPLLPLGTRGGPGRHRPGGGLLRERPLADDDRQHAARGRQ